jgi:type IV conjugative transfer system protein TraL
MTNPLLRHLDAPVRFLSFTASDFIAYLMPFFLGALLDSLFVVPALGIGFVFLVKKMVKRFPRFYVMRFLYWSLPTRRMNRLLRIDWPASHKRIWIK